MKRSMFPGGTLEHMEQVEQFADVNKLFLFDPH